MREEPGETPAVSLRGRRNETRQSQSKDAKVRTHNISPNEALIFPNSEDLIVAVATGSAGQVAITPPND
jgi:hypothetical protein